MYICILRYPIDPIRLLNASDMKRRDPLMTKVSTVKFLGVTLDENLTFNDHVKKIATKISKSDGVMRRLHCQLPAEVMLSYTIPWCI